MLIEIPRLAGARRLLCIQPHYDDNDIAAGGTIAALADRGAQVAYLTITDDRLGVTDSELGEAELARQLRAEQAVAGRELGVAEHFWLDYPDAGPYEEFELRRQIVRHLRLWRPDVVLAPDPWLPYEAHGDHIRAGRAAAEACLLFGNPRLTSGDSKLDAGFEPYALSAIAFYFTAEPNTFFDISATRERKHRALDAYRSQLGGDEGRAVHRVLEAKERQWAEASTGSHAEALKVLHPRHLHCNPDADVMFARR